MDTAAEELGHIEMLATAVVLNLRGAPLALQEAAAALVQGLDGNGAFTSRPMEPMCEEPNLDRARENSGARAEQL